MANHTINYDDYSQFLRILETTDPAHADTFNPLFQRLINNDAFIKALVERLVQEHTHSGVDGDGAKIPLSNIEMPTGEGGIVTDVDLAYHINERNPHGTRAVDVGAYVKPATGIPKTDLETAVQTALSNGDNAILKGLLTAAGDIIYASAPNTPARLPKGTDGQALVLSGGIPTWGVPTWGVPTWEGAGIKLFSYPSTSWSDSISYTNNINNPYIKRIPLGFNGKSGWFYCKYGTTGALSVHFSTKNSPKLFNTSAFGTFFSVSNNDLGAPVGENLYIQNVYVGNSELIVEIINTDTVTRNVSMQLVSAEVIG